MGGTRYSTLPQKKGSQRSSRTPEQAFFSRKSGGWSCARRGYGRGRRGTQGHGRGGSSSKGGGSSCKGVSSRSISASGSSHGGRNRPFGRCWECNSRGHIREECTTKESDVLAKWAVRVEVAAAKEAAAAPLVPAVVATAAVTHLLAAVGDATVGATSRRSAP